MAEITLIAEPGRETGSRASGRLRALGRIPGVIYGHGIDPLPVSVDGRELRAALTTDAGLNALLSLKVGSVSHLTLARAIQRHPVRHTVTHVDFQIVRRDEIVSADVHLSLVGDAHEVAMNNGVVEHLLQSLAVKATPDRIPHVIEVDISQLVIGDTIRVGDLRLPHGVSTDIDPDEAVVIAQGSAVEAEVAAAGEGEPDAAAAPAEAASGAPASGGGEG